MGTPANAKGQACLEEQPEKPPHFVESQRERKQCKKEAYKGHKDHTRAIPFSVKGDGI